MDGSCPTLRRGFPVAEPGCTQHATASTPRSPATASSAPSRRAFPGKPPREPEANGKPRQQRRAPQQTGMGFDRPVSPDARQRLAERAQELARKQQQQQKKQEQKKKQQQRQPQPQADAQKQE